MTPKPDTNSANSGAEDSSGLKAADAFARELLGRVEPLRFGVAGTTAELEMVYRLRYAVVLDQGWARAEDFPARCERDAFDERAIQIVAWDGKELVGTTRLVAPAAGCRLPVEQVFDLNLTRYDRVIDMGRTCRLPGRPDPGQKILWGLLARSWIEVRALGFTEICGIFAPGMARLYRRLGFGVEYLGEPRLHWGEMRRPVLVRPSLMCGPWQSQKR